MIHEATINPFASRYVRPGAIPFLDSGDVSIDAVWSRLVANRFRGQIIGPHGSGKSTLLAALAERGSEQESEWLQVTLSTQCKSNHSQVRDTLRSVDDNTRLVIDGFEQLNMLTRWYIARSWRGPLLVTSHRQLRIKLPLLVKLTPSPQLATRIVERLTCETDFVVDPALVRAAYNRHKGNFRDMLFDLYDRYERKRDR